MQIDRAVQVVDLREMARMPRPIQLDCETGLDAKEIDNAITHLFER